MMIVDASALAAVFFMEPGCAQVPLRAAADAVRLHFRGQLLEIAIVSDNRDAPEQMVDLDLFLAEAGVEVVPVTTGQARIARDAHRRFGRGNHPVGLNFGDCFVYALAKERNLPLLFKGDDFTQTDLPPAL